MGAPLGSTWAPNPKPFALAVVVVVVAVAVVALVVLVVALALALVLVVAIAVAAVVAAVSPRPGACGLLCEPEVGFAPTGVEANQRNLKTGAKPQPSTLAFLTLNPYP